MRWTASKRRAGPCPSFTPSAAGRSATSTSAAGRATGPTPASTPNESSATSTPATRTSAGSTSGGSGRWRRSCASASTSAPARASTRSSRTTSPATKTRPASRSAAPISSASTAGSLAKSTDAGMSVALKNDPEQVRALVGSFDFAVVEECFAIRRVREVQPLRRSGKGGLHGRVRRLARRLLPAGGEAPLRDDQEGLRPFRQALAALPGERRLSGLSRGPRAGREPCRGSGCGDRDRGSGPGARGSRAARSR